MSSNDAPHDPPSYTKDDIEDMLDVAILLDIEFTPGVPSSRDPEKITQAEAHIMAETIKQRIHDGWMREKERQEKKRGRHGV